MGFRFLKQKAGLMIYLIVSMIFVVTLFSPVAAQEENSKGCCESTKSGEACLYTTENDCSSEYKFASFQKCEDTSFCKLGCCINEDEGLCSKMTSKAACENVGHKWAPVEDCQGLNECDKGCCVLGEASCAYVTEQKCDMLLRDYPELEKDFRETGSEADCINFCRDKERGCCVNDGECRWTTKETCGLDDGTGMDGFYEDIYCSNENLPCEHCLEQERKGCLEGSENVYWFDSCGNPEGVAEKCDYATGSLCGYSEESSEAICMDLNCGSTWDNPVVEGDGISRINGESWCQFDGAVGPSLDLPGSRHYRHICINGIEIMEPCKDFREEVCRQTDVVEGSNLLYSAAGCRENRWQDCTELCNTAMSKTDEDERDLAYLLDKRCCERTDLRDCFWAGDDDEGICLPMHPPGFKFWDQEKTTSSVVTSNTQMATHEQCDIASRSCKTLFIRDVYTQWNWVCEKDGNCQCFSEDYLVNQNNYCRSIGDCGAHYNFLGEFGDEGFTRFWDKNYQGWDITYSKSLGSKAAETSSEPAIVLDNKMAGPFEEVWANADRNIYVAEASKSSILATGVTAGVFAGVAAALIIALKFTVGLKTASVIFWASKATTWGITGTVTAYLAIAVVVYIVLTEFVFKKHQMRNVETTCGLWQPPFGGDNCELCGQDWKVCSEYRCKSLGANCEFIPENEGTGKNACFNADPNDVSRPRIQPSEKALKIISKNKDITDEFEIVESDNGYTITGRKIPAFSKVTFGIETDELSMCKLSKELKNVYSEMDMRFDEHYFDYEHNLTLSNLLPAETYNFYIICKDPAGNPKDDGQTAPYVVKMSTDNTPDLEAPRIVAASIPDQGFVAADKNTTILRLVVDEVSPFECKASKEDKEFEFMEMNMSCAAMPQDSLFTKNSECEIELPVRDDLNTYYFRCKDEPENTERRNENSESFVWRAFKAEPLFIKSVEPSGTVYFQNVTLKVVTEGGPENGKAVCYYNNIEFFNTNSDYHTQTLVGLSENDYEYLIECKDIANNVDTAFVNFTIDVDLEPSKIKSIIRPGDKLRIELDELAECEFAFEPFVLGEGRSTGGLAQIHNLVPDRKEKLYFQCLDRFGNLMNTIIFNRVQIKP